MFRTRERSVLKELAGVSLAQDRSRCAYLIQRLGVFVESAMGIFQGIVDGIEGRFDGVLELGQSYRCLVWIWKDNQ